MKVEIKKVLPNQYEVEISHGNQFFHLDMGYSRTASKKEAEFFAKMFRKALKASYK